MSIYSFGCDNWIGLQLIKRHRLKSFYLGQIKQIVIEFLKYYFWLLIVSFQMRFDNWIDL
jgi:hypothetical protein